MKQSSLIRFVSVVVAVLMVAGSVQAAGFSIYEASASGNAMGGAVVGSAIDASTIYYNPAAMTDLPGLQMLAGVTVISPFADVKFAGQSSTKMHEQYFWMPHAYASWQMADKWWFGFGQYTEYGLGTKYPFGWAGAASSVEADLETTTLNPNIAYKVTDELSLDLGLRIMYVNFSYKNQPYAGSVLPVYRSSIVSVEGDDVALAWNSALQYKINDEWSFGFVYRSPTWTHIKGSAMGSGAAFQSGYQYTHADGKIIMPASYTAGVNYKPKQTKWNFGGAVTYTEWSSFEMLNINLNEKLQNNAPLPGISSISKNKNWQDVFRFSVGTQYEITDKLAWRSGYVFDIDPISAANADLMLPAGDRHIIGTGFGYKITEDVNVDIAYNLLLGVSQDRTLRGNPALGQADQEFSIKNSGAHMLAISAGIKF